jgi:cold shock CspA family protein
MNGIIKTYLPNKKYGFIKGDDGRNYYFHADAFMDKSKINMICEEAIVTFYENASPKGYKALKCSLLNPSDILTFTVPDNFITSRANVINGWEIIEYGNWIVHGSSRHSPQSAKNDAIDSAIAIGANALIDLNYYKTTGSESGTGNGIHHFTIHNFRGRVATIAKRNSNGQYKADDLSGLNQRAESLKEELVKETNRNRKKRNILHTSAITLSIPFIIWTFLAKNPIILLPIFLIFLIEAIIIYFHYTAEYGSWLERA